MIISIQDFALVFGLISGSVAITNFLLTKVDGRRAIKVVYSFYTIVVISLATFSIIYYNEIKFLNSIGNNANNIIKEYSETKNDIAFIISAVSFFETYKEKFPNEFREIVGLGNKAKYYENSKKYGELSKVSTHVRSLLLPIIK